MTLTPAAMAALFGAMALLAALPSTSVLAVTSRAAAQGFGHGALVALGVVAGDAVFILIALFGLAALMDALHGAEAWVRGLGGAYLLWLGIRIWRARSAQASAAGEGGGSAARRASFTSGLLITLGDQKAILFYLGFFPAFLDLAAMTTLDALAIVLIATVAVGGVKLLYAAAADRTAARLGPRYARGLNALAACVMIGVGLLLLAGLALPPTSTR